MKVLCHTLPLPIARVVIVLCAAFFVASTPSTARAAGMVGTGTPESCTDAALDIALSGGGLVTFNCGPAPVTIDISSRRRMKIIAADTVIDGDDLVTISGGHSVRVFFVAPGIVFTGKNLTISDGAATLGGGIFNESGSVVIMGCTFKGNAASPAPDEAGGGGIYNSGTLTITHSVFQGNEGSKIGGAIANFGSLVVDDSTFAENRAINYLGGAGFGGALYNVGTATIANSVFADNGDRDFREADPKLVDFGDSGGAIFNSGTLAVANSSFVSNRAATVGGGIYSESGSLTIVNSTFTGNGARGGGVVPPAQAGGAIFGSAALRNTIVANSIEGSNCRIPPGSSIIDGGHNLDDGESCGFMPANGSLSDTDPQLDPAGLQDNGGPTQTVALCTGVDVPAGCPAASPAVDGGDQVVCAMAPVHNLDQRGYVRPGGDYTQCSIGAYEADATLPACIGDCNESGRVTVDELVMGVNIALSTATLDQCQAFDCDGTGEVTVDCLVAAVDGAVNGCGPE